MAQIDYSSIFTSISTSDSGEGSPYTSPILISFPFKDSVFTGDEFKWVGPEGFQRFLDIFSPRAVIGTNADGTKLLADNISYLQEITGQGVSAKNIGTLCAPNWVGSLVNNGIDPRESYWIKFNDDIEAGSAVTGTQDTGSHYDSYKDFYDFDNAIDGETWGSNTITDWAFLNADTGIPSKIITGDLISSDWKLEGIKADKKFFIGYPFAEQSPNTSSTSEFGLKYPDQLMQSIIGTSVASAYIEASSAWGGSGTYLSPGRGYIMTVKSSTYLDTSIIDTEDNDSVQLFVGGHVEGFGVSLESYEATLGGVTYKASNYNPGEVRGSSYSELFSNPDAFAGFVNWSKNDGLWNPDNLPQSNIDLLNKFENHGILKYNGILDSNFNYLANEEGNSFDSFMFIVWYDPIRTEHFIGTGHRLGTNETKKEGFTPGEDDTNFGGYNEYKATPSDLRSYSQQTIKTHVDNYCVVTTENGFSSGSSSEATYWTQDATVTGTLFEQFQKQRPFMLAGVAPTGYDAMLGGDMPWTYIMFHSPTQKFFQLRPAHVRYKVDNMLFPEPYNPDNLTKVMHYYMDNHRNTTQGQRWTDAYSGSDAEGSWALSTSTTSGWHAMQGVSCSWPDQGGDGFYSPSEPYLSIVNSEGNIESVWLAQANDRYVSGNQLYLEMPMQLVIQEATSITLNTQLSDISSGPFEKDVNKSIEGG